MRPGFALIVQRLAPFSLGVATDIAAEITRPLVRRPVLAVVAGIFFTAVVAAQAQESVEPDVLPSLAEPPAASAEPPPSASTDPFPALPQSVPSTVSEPLPSSPEPLPSSEQAFPSSPEPLSLFNELHYRANKPCFAARSSRSLRRVQ